MIINHNMQALNAHRQMGTNAANAQKSMEKLSSGLKINRAGDDAAGLTISEKMRGQIRGLDQAGRNAQDGISMIQTAEGALNETHSILQRMRELSVQSANGTNTDSDRSALQEELNQLTSEINRIGNTTEFNTQKILNGGAASASTATSTNVTEATGASITSGTVVLGDHTTDAITGTIKVDGTTFDIGAALSKDWSDANFGGTSIVATEQDVVDALKNVTAGQTKLGDILDITVEGNTIKFASKSTGADSKIEIQGNEHLETLLGYTAKQLDSTDVAYVGSKSGADATTQQLGVQGSKISADVTLTKNTEFKLKLEDGSEATVKLDLQTDKKYALGSSNEKEKANAFKELTKDINNALQKAGLDDKVTASISNNNELQLVSKTGKDLTVVSGLTEFGFTANKTSTNIQQVVGGTSEGAGFEVKFQIGANAGQSLGVTIEDMRASALGITGNSNTEGFTQEDSVTNGTDNIKNEAALNISTQDNATKSVEVIDKAIEKVSAQRSNLGAVQNRLEHTINNLGTSSENLTAAESRIRDVDMAKEMMTMSKNNILNQAAQAMLAQANQNPQQVLQLLR